MKQLQPGIPWADDVLRAASVLYDAGAKSVWLIGSRARDQALDRLSDFDLCVEGLPEGTAIARRAARELWGKVDIIRLESARADIRWFFLRERVFVPWAFLESRASPLRSYLHYSLARKRILAVTKLISKISPRSVIDFGCGNGELLAELVANGQLERLTGVDYSRKALENARQKITRAAGGRWDQAVELHEGLITCRDPRYLGHDVVTAIEVIEHLEAPQLAALVGVMFDFVHPKRIVITTPNADFNAVWFSSGSRRRRHPDHRFEWSRKVFGEWSMGVAATNGYNVDFAPVGSESVKWGPPTQLAVFDRLD